MYGRRLGKPSFPFFWGGCWSIKFNFSTFFKTAFPFSPPRRPSVGAYFPREEWLVLFDCQRAILFFCILYPGAAILQAFFWATWEMLESGFCYLLRNTSVYGKPGSWVIFPCPCRWGQPKQVEHIERQGSGSGDGNTQPLAPDLPPIACRGRRFNLRFI
jgi:hypothetical protein